MDAQHLARVCTLACLYITLVSCGSDSNSSSSKAKLEITSVSTQSNYEYEIGDEISIDYSYETKGVPQEKGVSISFFIIEKNDSVTSNYDSWGEVFHLVSIVDQPLGDGSHSGVVEAKIPDIYESGKYYIVAAVDSSEEISEAVNTDNVSDALDPIQSPVIDIVNVSNSDIQILDGKITKGVVILETPEQDIKEGEEKNDVIGYLQAQYLGSDAVSALLKAEVLVGGNYEAVDIWNFELEDYSQDRVIEFEDELDNYDIGYDLRFKPSQLEYFYANFNEIDNEENKITIKLTIEGNSLSEFESNLENNEQVITVPYYFLLPDEVANDEFDISSVSPASAARGLSGKIAECAGLSTLDKDWSDYFNETFGNKKSMAGAVDFRTGTLLNGDQFSGENIGRVDFWVLNKQISMVKITADAKYVFADGGSQDKYPGLEVKVFGQKVYDKRLTNKTSAWEYKWEKKQTVVKSTVWVAAFPVTLETGMKGTLGTSADFAYTSSTLSADMKVLETGLDGYASAKLDAGVASITLKLDLLGVHNTLKADTALNFLFLSSDICELEADIKMKDEIELLKGKLGIELYAWLIGTTTEWIYKATTPAYSKTHTIYSKTKKLKL